MRFTIIANPRSGRGKASKLAHALEQLADARGHLINTIFVGPQWQLEDEQICESDRLIIVGGDGTVHHMLRQLARTQTPFYHLATGTANLIALAFRMSSRPSRAIQQLETDCQPSRIDLPECNGHPFLIMTSLGMDASVIHRLEESRTLGGFRAYIRPVIREVLSPRIARLRVTIDDESFDCKPGVLVVANLPNYGGHFNPCRGACCDDSLLDIANIPGTTSLGVGVRYLSLLARLPAAKLARGSIVRVEAVDDSHIQIDGEKPKAIASLLTPGATLEFRMSESSVYAHAPRLRGGS
ncbi:MAG: hypothetical protein KDA29_12455 [Phycisphaerales bacterium]|nr:hypothetical protein [Phycisphaerales bacterium]